MIALLSTVQRLPDDERAAVERALVPFARRAAVGALAAEIAHDAGNALFGLIGLLDLMVEDEPVGGQRRTLLRNSAAELDRALAPLFRFASAGNDEGAAADLAAVAAEALALYRHGRRKLLTVETRLPSDPVRVACPPSLASQAIVQLLLAADPVSAVVVAPDGTITVSPARETSLDEVVAARIASDRGGELERHDGALRLRFPSV